jgi:hypothetical protein
LQIAIHDNDPIAFTLIKAGGDTAMLAEIAAELQSNDTRIIFREQLDDVPGVISTAILD